MYNILYVDLQPILWDIYKLVYDLLCHTEHFFHKDHAKYMDLSIGYLYKLYYQGIQHHVDILLVLLKLQY